MGKRRRRTTYLGDGSAEVDVEREGEGLAASLLADTEGDVLRCAYTIRTVVGHRVIQHSSQRYHETRRCQAPVERSGGG
jgi:hypothetical protein